MDAPGLELARPGDVRFFVEAGLQLDQHGDLRLLVARLRERLDYWGVRADTVEGLLYGEHLGVVGRRPDEVDNGCERVVGMVEQDVAVPDGLGDRPRAPDLQRHSRRYRGVEQI